MPSKYQEYRQMADTAERQLTSSYKSWTQFLRTAARLYKYPYNEQVMIHAQRPDATACAEYDFWNKKMGRFVRRGSTGIALIDTSGQKPQLRYVFDMADTGEREHSRPMHLWQFRAEHEDAVAAALERSYGVSGKDGIVEQMESAAAKLAREYWADYKRDILHNIDDSYLDGYDEFNTEVQFRNAAKVSITYMLMSRCGLEPEAYLEPEDFMPVFDFNTPAAVAALGTAVSEISQQVLRQIEVAIRNYERERSQNHDRIDLHEERRLPDSQPEAERGTGEQAPGQVRDAAEDLPSGASSHPLEPDDPVRDAVPAPAGNRRDGAAEAGADDAGADEIGGRDGSAESQRPDALGGADEQSESAGRRDHSERAGVQLTNDAPEAEPAQPTAAYQMSLFPTEAEQIAYIDTAESVNSTPSAFSMFILQDDIDHILRTGGNADEARMKIAAEFSKQKPVEDRAAFLKNLYYGGNGLITENGRFSAWYGDEGIHIANGDAARHLRSAQVIRWTDAAERVEELLDGGTFATNLEVTEALRYERLSIAVAVWNLYHDFSDEAKSRGYLSCLGNIHSTNFPEETERLTDDLLNLEFRERLLAEYKVFLDAYHENRELLRFHFHRPQALLTRMEDLSLPRKEYLEETFNTTITEEQVRHAVHVANQGRLALRRFYETMKNDPAPMEGSKLFNVLYGSQFKFDKEAMPAEIDALTEKIMKEYEEGEKPERRKRILLTGCPSSGAPMKVVKAIEENGGNVVVYENCGGAKSVDRLIDEEAEDIYQAIAERYLAIGCSVMTPDTNRYELLERLLDEYQVEGVVEMTLQACHTYNIEAKSIEKRVKEKGLPYIHIETDYSQADVGQLDTRIAAFLEMI